jgi:hypothetical protein
MFLFRATHGKVLAGSSSFASQTTTAAGRHIVSNPIRSSKRYELTATSATSLNQARLVCSNLGPEGVLGRSEQNVRQDRKCCNRSVRSFKVVHPVVHLFGNTRSNRVDGPDEATLLTWENSTGLHPLDIPAHSLKVETRVRTPLGLLSSESAGLHVLA